MSKPSVAGLSHSQPSLASPGSLRIKCIIYEDGPMHIHELIAFQGQLLSVKNLPIMNYCMMEAEG